MIERTNLYDQIAWNKRKAVLLVLLFIPIVVGLGWLFGRLSGLGNFGLVLAVFISVILSIVSYWYSDSIVLSASGAQPADPKEFRKLHEIVEDISIASGTPKPRVFVINDAAINAFATGRDPQHAAIAVTTGALEKLNRQELEGVIAHELSHVKNFDIRFMAVVAVLVGIVVLLGDWLLRASFLGGRRDDREGGKGGAALFALGIILGILMPIFAQLIRLAVSRRREFLADSDGALLTRNPEGLANALRKIQSDGNQLKAASNATAHLYFANPFKNRNWLSNLFSTHPPIEERIRRLESSA
ncbi:M48 family metallopeptidase [Candidatus Micrarchaeota archaeon]|nr:M48 family metallopeptidase [Candidatus Micrarchaeota archaeon]MBI5177107.1 M48 family metallopeptidase [Candidatus Micrarchaeota archaeon]